MADEPDPAHLPPWPGEPDSLVVRTDTGDQVHYLDWGGEQGAFPPILLVHGLAATAWTWAPIARRLRRVTRVLALDLRGHGLSDSPRTGYDLESLAFDALTVLVANGFGMDADGPPAVVAGHGLGAIVAASMGIAQPGSIVGIGLVDGGWEDLAEATGQSPAEFHLTAGEPPEVMASMAAYLQDRREFDPGSWDPDQERAARAAVDEKQAGHVTQVLRPHALKATAEAMFDYRPLESLSQLSMPLLIAVAESGSADDESVRERRIALDDVLRGRAEANLPPADVRTFSRAGHNLMRYRPEELTAALVALLSAASDY